MCIWWENSRHYSNTKHYSLVLWKYLVCDRYHHHHPYVLIICPRWEYDFTNSIGLPSIIWHLSIKGDIVAVIIWADRRKKIFTRSACCCLLSSTTSLWSLSRDVPSPRHFVLNKTIEFIQIISVNDFFFFGKCIPSHKLTAFNMCIFIPASKFDHLYSPTW